MRMFRGYLFLSLFTLAAPIVAFVDRVTERIGAFLLSLFAPEPLRLATDGPDLVRRDVRDGFSPSLLESLRHEKGVPRFGAARNV